METVVLEIEVKGCHQQEMILKCRVYDGHLATRLSAFICSSVDMFSVHLMDLGYIPYRHCTCRIALPVYVYPRCRYHP